MLLDTMVEDRTHIDIIRQAIREELAAHEHRCRFDMSDTDAREMGEYMRMLSLVGDGSIPKGIEVIRDNHRWLKTQRDRGDKLSAAAAAIVVTTAVGGILTAIWLGLKALIVGANVR